VKSHGIGFHIKVSIRPHFYNPIRYTWHCNDLLLIICITLQELFVSKFTLRLITFPSRSVQTEAMKLLSEATSEGFCDTIGNSLHERSSFPNNIMIFLTLNKWSNSWCRPAEYGTTCLMHFESTKRFPRNLNFVTRGREKAEYCKFVTMQKVSKQTHSRRWDFNSIEPYSRHFMMSWWHSWPQNDQSINMSTHSWGFEGFWEKLTIVLGCAFKWDSQHIFGITVWRITLLWASIQLYKSLSVGQVKGGFLAGARSLCLQNAIVSCKNLTELDIFVLTLDI
jgi:hypothetical protein